MSKTLAFKLLLVSDPRLLCVARAAVGEMARTMGFSDGEIRSIVLAVDESLTNVIRHAYGGSDDQPIAVTFCKKLVKRGTGMRGALEITLVDRGVPVDPEKLQGRSLDEIRPGGLGLHFIRETMDSVTFRRNGGRNYLRLLKFLTPTSPTGKIGDAECR